MQTKFSTDLPNGGNASPESDIQLNKTAAAVTECGDQPQPAPLGGFAEGLDQSDECAPRLVIRGERIEIVSGYKNRAKLIYSPKTKEDGESLAALTNYLNTTFPFDGSEDSIVNLKNHLGLFLGEAFGSFQPRRGGLHGYTKSFEIGKTGALLAFGGQRDTALISFPGSACALITDWGRCYHLFHEILKGRITRWDGAVNVFDGSPSVDDAVEFYLAGQFNAGGNKASCIPLLSRKPCPPLSPPATI